MWLLKAQTECEAHPSTTTSNSLELLTDDALVAYQETHSRLLGWKKKLPSGCYSPIRQMVRAQLFTASCHQVISGVKQRGIKQSREMSNVLGLFQAQAKFQGLDDFPGHVEDPKVTSRSDRLACRIKHCESVLDAVDFARITCKRILLGRLCVQFGNNTAITPSVKISCLPFGKRISQRTKDE